MNFIHATVPVSHTLSEEQHAQALASVKKMLIDKVQSRGDLPYVSVEKQKQLIDQLMEFELGKFLMLEQGGIDGYWTHYIVTYPERRHLQELGNLETFLLEKAPTVLATQQRFKIFKEQTQKHLKEGCSLATIPSGVMSELLDLDFNAFSNFTLTGIDLDPSTFSLAKSYAEEKGLSSHCEFFQQDVWNLDMSQEFDVITSNGFTIYEPDDKKVIDIYRRFHNALKPEGILVTSFLTPPPIPGFKTEWKLECINPQNALLQKIIFADILDAKWQVFRSEEKVIAQLKEAGFSDVEIFYDEAHIFPTVVAK